MNSPTAAAHVKEERFARIFDREIAPVWHDRFSRMIVRSLAHLPPASGEGRFVLDVHARTGRTTAELLHRLESGAKVLAIEDQAAQITLAKTKVRPEWRQRVYFKEGDFDDVTEMDDETYDLTVANLVLGEVVADWRAAIGELVRITKPGGVVLASMPLYGTWGEVEDLFEEVLRDGGRRDAIQTLNRLRRMRPRAKALADACEGLEIDERDYIVEHERFELLFRSGREFLFSPVIEHGPLRLWRAVLGDRSAQEQQQIFWRLKEAIDTYYAKHVLATTVIAGLIQIRVPGPAIKDDFSAIHWSRYPTLDAVFRGGSQRAAAAPSPAAATTDDGGDDFEFDLELEDDGDDLDIDVELDDAIGAAAETDSETETETEVAAEATPVPVEHELDRESPAQPQELTDPDPEVNSASSSSRPKTAAQSLVDAQILDESDLTAEPDPSGNFDPSQPLQQPGVPSTVDKVDTDALFNDQDTGSYAPLDAASVKPPPELDEDAAPERAESTVVDDDLLGDEFSADDLLEEVEEIDTVGTAPPPPPGGKAGPPPLSKPTAAPKKRLRLPPLPKKKPENDG